MPLSAEEAGGAQSGARAPHLPGDAPARGRAYDW